MGIDIGDCARTERAGFKRPFAFCLELFVLKINSFQKERMSDSIVYRQSYASTLTVAHPHRSRLLVSCMMVLEMHPAQCQYKSTGILVAVLI